jgi:hypothetical protein
MNSDSNGLLGKMLFTTSVAALITFTSVGQTVNTNAFASWFTNKSLTWSAETNGFRVGVDVGPNLPAKEIGIWVLSSTNSGFSYVLPPSDKSPSLELRDTNGVVIQATPKEIGAT